MANFIQSIIIKEYNYMKNEIKKYSKCCRTFYIKKETYCVSCKKNITNENSSVRRIKQNRLMLLSNCGTCGQKKKRKSSLKIKKRLIIDQISYQNFIK